MHLFYQAHGAGKAAAGVSGTEGACFTLPSINGFAHGRGKQSHSKKQSWTPAP